MEVKTGFHAIDSYDFIERHASNLLTITCDRAHLLSHVI